MLVGLLPLCFLPSGFFANCAMPSPSSDLGVIRQLSYRDGDQSVSLYQSRKDSSLFFQSKMSCDVDGAPNAYHSLNDDLALDTIDSAEGARLGGVANGPLVCPPCDSIVAYSGGQPFVQPDGPYQGYFVSRTTYECPIYPDIDPRRYLDARTVPYVVLPEGLVPEAQIGDLAAIYDPVSRRVTYAIYGDMGPPTECGEVSLATLKNLGANLNDGKSSPNETRHDLCYLVFPGSHVRFEKGLTWPPTAARIEKFGGEELRRRGGTARLEHLTESVQSPVTTEASIAPDEAD